MVGRDAELRALTEAIDDPECGGVALIGAAGFGKTRLAAQALAAAQARGMTVESVRATRSSAGVPLAALTPFLNELELPAELDATLLLAAAEAIDARRGDQRMVLFIDDAHELDDASAILLDRLVEHGGPSSSSPSAPARAIPPH